MNELLDSCRCGAGPLHPSTYEAEERHAGVDFRLRLGSERCARCGEELITGPTAERGELLIALALAQRGVVSGDALRAMLGALDLSGVEAARMLDVTPETVSRWLSGKLAVPRATWVVVASMVADEVAGREDTRNLLQVTAIPIPRPQPVLIEVPRLDHPPLSPEDEAQLREDMALLNQ